MVTTATVHLWGQDAGAVTWLPDRDLAAFEFEPRFLASGLDIAPLTMPRAEAPGQVFLFPALNRETFMGLPGLLADALPDKFGNALIDAWLSRTGRTAADFNPVERLCYVGDRGMGALEFRPALTSGLKRRVAVDVAELVLLARGVTAERLRLNVQLGGDDGPNAEALRDILRVGTSAGGARAKAVIAMDDAGRIVSGQGTAPEGYAHWIIKFDGVGDLELGQTQDYGRIEYAYSLMAKAAGITMTECRLLQENGRAHFLTQRFDRTAQGKRHLQSLCGLAHFDFNAAGAYGYEQVFEVMRRLRLPRAAAVEQYRRMIFNVVARNQDDHTKNIAFLMDRDGQWQLAPAFDMIYAHNPRGRWTSRHQMTINGKREGFVRDDLLAVGRSLGLHAPGQILEEIVDTVGRWPDYARAAGVDPERTREIHAALRLTW
ncbi:MAG: type II toxin-antitoxin system HipA family toxin [Gammaproteobacteria bacterium]|nr:type II toxin-antitoxin system HipA family toxin [Gammaproteobacteria bacterium]